MNATSPSLKALARGEATVPRPPVRWKTRILLPFAILAGAAGLLAYAARATLWPTIDVWVVPVVAKPTVGGSGGAGGGGGGTGGQAGPGQILVQAPGWIEPSPYAVSAPALTDGVIKEVLVLEGQNVDAGQVVARLIDEDAKLSLQRAEAELAERHAEVERARADMLAATARRDEMRDEVNRKRALVEAGGVSEGQFARLELRLTSMEREIDAANAAVRAAESTVRTAEVMRDEARLMLDRTEIRSPVAGVVMARLVEPGARISMTKGGGDAMAGSVIRVYDPAHLQVRVEVPLGDAAKVGIDTPAQIVTEALPDRVFKGRIIRIVHEANIQRNTVQVKVSIDEPEPALKPEMLTRVRFYSSPREGEAAAPRGKSEHIADAGVRLLVPVSALVDRQESKARLWIVDQSGGQTVAAVREVGLGGEDGSYIEVTQGVNPADRIVVDAPSNLTAGARIRVLGEKVSAQP